MTKKQEVDADAIKETYKKWYETVEILRDNAEKGFMPLVAEALELTINIAKVYEKGYLAAIKNK